jgi:hypothetical protein
MVLKMKPVLFMDFDGVLNFFGSRNHYRNHNKFGYLKRGSVNISTGDVAGGWGSFSSYYHLYTINWSAELVRKLTAVNVDWVWLTSWNKHTYKLDDLLEITIPTSTLDWDSDSASKDHTHPAKYVALKDYMKANPRPFIWVDDSATVHFNPDDFDVPYLLVVPNEDLGLTPDDLAKITDFVATHS